MQLSSFHNCPWQNSPKKSPASLSRGTREEKVSQRAARHNFPEKRLVILFFLCYGKSNLVWKKKEWRWCITSLLAEALLFIIMQNTAVTLYSHSKLLSEPSYPSKLLQISPKILFTYSWQFSFFNKCWWRYLFLRNKRLKRFWTAKSLAFVIRNMHYSSVVNVL